MKKKSSIEIVEMPELRQRRYPVPCSDLGETNAIPRDTEYDMRPEYSRTRMSKDEQTFCVVKKGNCP